MAEAAIELIGINKSFGAVHANRDINLEVQRGTIHGIVGENGAGKSTLMSILYGFYQADSGEIHVNGRPTTIKTPNDAIAAGIGMVHQHFMLVENFTVLENVILGAEGEALLNKSASPRRARSCERLEREYGLEVDPDAIIEELPVGLQQRVEILKALYRGAEILILDEPTGVLTPAEADHLFRILEQLQGAGQDHRPDHPQAARDHGDHRQRLGHAPGRRWWRRARPAETTVEELAELMVGRRVLLRVEKGAAKPGDVKLSVENLTVKDSRGVTMVDDVSFDVRAGEIVGIAGVAGNGQSELLEAISGIRTRRVGHRAARRQADRRRPATPIPASCATAASPMCRRTGTMSAWCWPSRRARTRSSAITTSRTICNGPFLDIDAIRDGRRGEDREIRHPPGRMPG